MDKGIADYVVRKQAIRFVASASPYITNIDI